MFESIRAPDLAARFRAAAVPPFAAFLAAEAYLTLYPLLQSVPALLFRAIALVTLGGTIAGAVQIARALHGRRGELDGRSAGWMSMAAFAVLLCGRIFTGMMLPWL